MASRNFVYESLALRSRESTGGGRILSIMTAEAGLVDTFVFGGPKSKLKSLASPYSSGRAFIYQEPGRDMGKLSDYEVRESFSGLREGLRKIWGAGLTAEFLLKTHGGGGDYPEVLELARAALRTLEAGSDEDADYPILLFLWRMIEILGLQPEVDTCASCGLPIPQNAPRLYSFQSGGFLCSTCAEAEGARGSAAVDGTGRYGRTAGSGSAFAGAVLPAGAARWLSASASLDFAEAAGRRLDQASLDGLRALLFGLARSAAEAPLACLEVGAGIL